MKKTAAFKPAWWLTNPHMQTIWPVIFRQRNADLSIQRERMELPDGDFLDLDWVTQAHPAPLVLVLHGFEGSIDSHYAKGILKEMHRQGWSGVLMHFRGCSGEFNRLPREYHAGETQDLAWVVSQLRARFPDQPMAAIGYSLGGNVLLKWLGETRSANPLAAAIAVSVPFELELAANRIQQGFSQLYQWNFLRSLRKRLAAKFKIMVAPMDVSNLYSLATVYDFDDQITAPLHGFLNATDYYAEASSRQYLHAIGKPTLILHAKDDPFSTPDAIPNEEELSPSVELEVAENGGHVGFVAGLFPWSAHYWLEERMSSFLRAYL